jgi:hypothetical protein
VSIASIPNSVSPLQLFAAVLGNARQIDEAFSVWHPSTNLDAPPSSEATTLSSSRDILASRHKKDRGGFYRGVTPSFGCNPSECLNAPSTTIHDNDLYRDILLPSSSADKVKTECIDDLPSSYTTTPSIPYVSDINYLIYCPLHR